MSDAFLSSLEIVPTVLAAAGLTPPKGVILDGFDAAPAFAGAMPSPRREMFWQRRNDKAARVGHLKWVASAKGNGLFDLADDVGEKHDLSQARPEELRAVKARFEQWQRTMDQAEPRGPFKDY